MGCNRRSRSDSVRPSGVEVGCDLKHSDFCVNICYLCKEIKEIKYGVQELAHRRRTRRT